jgi:hypothetical protein
MTLQEYLDAERFPWTTQRGLDPSGQLLIDAVNYDALKGYIEEGGALDEEQRGRWAELQIKIQDHARLARELAEATASGAAGGHV